METGTDMEFAEWVVSGLDQLRLGRLPAGNGFYSVASAGLGDDPRLAAYMNSGDAAARAELVQVIADAVAANPGFEQQLRTAAAATQPPQQGPVAGGKPPFLKTTNGMLVLIAAAVVVVGAGIGLAVGLGGSGGNLAGMLKGTWTCQASAPGHSDASGGPITVTIGDGTFSSGTTSGTFTQSGSTATLHVPGDPDNALTISDLPSGAGSFVVTLASSRHTSASDRLQIKGTVSAHKMTLTLPGDLAGAELNATCTK
jgi:hypothetical protein